MSLEYSLFFTCINIPQTNGLVKTSTCDCFSIGTERYAIDQRCMSNDYSLFFACINIPQTDGGVPTCTCGVVPTSTCDCFSIGTERYAIDLRCMSNIKVQFFTCLCIIYPNTDATRHCQFRTVWGICIFMDFSFPKPHFRAFG